MRRLLLLIPLVGLLSCTSPASPTPAEGERFLARGHVVRASRTVTACSGEVLAPAGSVAKQVAVMLATIRTV